ncbi:hypothetical protein H0H87_011095 [Tephrocybe sp. NHM501043]|nr:hypothetical protein H0H87_011095 [Tephrocybe sp. NHM501043]
MSRDDMHSFEITPGLGSQTRPRGYSERKQTGYYGTNTMFTTGDRRASHGMLGYGGFNREYGEGGPNRHNLTNNGQSFNPSSSSFNHHHLHRASPPLAAESIFRTSPASIPAVASSPSTLCWADIEPWMDEEYAKQVCALMGWDPVNINIPHPSPDPVTGQQANNPGFCYLTFATPAQASQVLAQINRVGNNHITMPNSSRPFVVNWASNAPPMPTAFTQSVGSATNALQQFPKEYSIFVGDLAPETSNSDLVAVFRNPVLGLRNDREPKFIRPFTSCKSAKIMLDAATGVSRGYGFVRFTDEADQQRALIEMHGLYCLSRPMRISPATAKYKGPTTNAPMQDLPQVQFPPQMTNPMDHHAQPVSVALPLPSSTLTKSVSVPIATTAPHTSSGNVSASASSTSLGQSNSTASISSGSGSNVNGVSPSGLASLTAEEMMNLPNSVLAQIAQQYANGEASPVKPASTSITQPFVQDTLPPRQASGQGDSGAPRYNVSEEAWKHHAQARAILGNLIGPNGEQLTSTDPYNTTVFVGGLSPLISEETLRTFFAPFGDIHYVKVPVGKHCGFVQFVRKADAERAIDKMQGFPVGGSRIRLSWGRSQYKAAQAAAQAAQASAIQSQYTNTAAQAAQASAIQSQYTNNNTHQSPNKMTPEQAMQLLQKLNTQGYLDHIPSVLSDQQRGPITRTFDHPFDSKISESVLGTRDASHLFDSFSSNGYQPLPEIHRSQSSFAPFSPDPNAFTSDTQREFIRADVLPHPSKACAPGFLLQELKLNTDITAGTSKASPSSTRPTSANRYGPFLEGSNAYGANRAPVRPESSTISRPASGQTRQISNGTRPEQKEFDPIEDLNNTLAGLEIDRPGATVVQFRVSEERTPSPST